MPEPTINITNELPKKPSIFSNPWFWVVVVAAAWIIFSQWKSCGKDVRYAELQQANDSLNADRVRTQQEKTRDSIEYISVLNRVVPERNKALFYRDSVTAVLNTLQKNNKGLPGRILEYVNITDTAFQHKCDSAARALLAASKSYDDLKLEDSLTKALYDYELKIRVQYANEVQKYLDSCNAQSYRQSELFNKAMDIYKPRWSLWGGIEARSDPYDNSVGGVIAFQNKQGTVQYSLSGGPTFKGQTYLQLRVIAKIKLRK